MNIETERERIFQEETARMQKSSPYVQKMRSGLTLPAGKSRSHTAIINGECQSYALATMKASRGRKPKDTSLSCDRKS